MKPGRAPAPRPGRARRAPLVIGHRGAPAHAPENTLASFERALGDGADWIECDVRLTADDAPIILHDATLDRTTDGRGPAAALPLARVLRLDAGSWYGSRFRGERVPTLQEVLALLDGRAGVNLELKTEDEGPKVRPAQVRLALAVEAVIAAARFRGPIVLSSFSRPALEAARAVMPRARLGLLASRSTRGLPAAHRALGLFSFHPHARLATTSRLATARRLGLRLLVWGADDLQLASRFRALAVDGVMADDPGGLRRALAAS